MSMKPDTCINTLQHFIWHLSHQLQHIHSLTETHTHTNIHKNTHTQTHTHTLKHTHNILLIKLKKSLVLFFSIPQWDRVWREFPSFLVPATASASPVSSVTRWCRARLGACWKRNSVIITTTGMTFTATTFKVMYKDERGLLSIRWTLELFQRPR